MAAHFPRRTRSAHKGSFGHLLLIGGASGFTGAVSMAARAAVRSGAGLVTVLTPTTIMTAVASAAPEIMVEAGDETETGSLSISNWTAWRDRIDDFSAIVAGPGMTRHEDTLVWIRQLIRESQVPLVFDADAVSVCSGQPHMIDRARCPVVITPHPGEMARLFGQDVQQVQEDRVGMAEAAAKYTGATVILKGAGTVVAEKDCATGMNLTGNPGMATGGSGDVLAGMVGAYLAQGLKPNDAARTAVYLHGRAGDRAARIGSQTGLSAGDLIDQLPAVHRELLGR